MSLFYKLPKTEFQRLIMQTNALIFKLVVFIMVGFTINVNAGSHSQQYSNYWSRLRRITADTTLPKDAIKSITTVIDASSTFNIDAVANLYTPNAVIADDEPPYSWSGPTAGVQWVNAIERACKDFKITKFKADIKPIKVVQQSSDVIYVIVPVEYHGNQPGGRLFEADGAFTFVLRWVGDKWLIKTQAWMPRKGM